MPEAASESEVERLTATICRSISLENLDLPDEFFPGHLSVALIDSVFRSRGEHDDDAVSATERYCNRFRIPRTRADRWEPPPAEEQETPAELIRRYDEFGAEWMAGEVFRNGAPLTETTIANARYVLRAARVLQRIGINVLQDILTRPSDGLEHELRFSAGLGESTIRLLLMYTGSDDFVRGDDHVRKFVADATGRRWVSRAGAERLVRRSAYTLVVSPQYLDHKIWRFCSMRAAAQSGGNVVPMRGLEPLVR